MQQIWQQLTAQLGAFDRQTGTAEQTAEGVQNIFIHCAFAKATADLVISFGSTGKEAQIRLDSQGRITGLGITNLRLTVTGLLPPGAPAGMEGRAAAVDHL